MVYFSSDFHFGHKIKAINEYKHPWIEQAECLEAIKNYIEKGDPFHAVLFHF